MRKLIRTLAVTSLTISLITVASAQEIAWTTKSKEAREWAKKGLMHYNNLESEVAYENFGRHSKKIPISPWSNL